jgi:hypothetical protein
VNLTSENDPPNLQASSKYIAIRCEHRRVLAPGPLMLWQWERHDDGTRRFMMRRLDAARKAGRTCAHAHKARSTTIYPKIVVCQGCQPALRCAICPAHVSCIGVLSISASIHESEINLFYIRIAKWQSSIFGLTPGREALILLLFASLDTCAGGVSDVDTRASGSKRSWQLRWCLIALQQALALYDLY